MDSRYYGPGEIDILFRSKLSDNVSAWNVLNGPINDLRAEFARTPKENIDTIMQHLVDGLKDINQHAAITKALVEFKEQTEKNNSEPNLMAARASLITSLQKSAQLGQSFATGDRAKINKAELRGTIENLVNTESRALKFKFAQDKEDARGLEIGDNVIGKALGAMLLGENAKQINMAFDNSKLTNAQVTEVAQQAFEKVKVVVEMGKSVLPILGQLERERLGLNDAIAEETAKLKGKNAEQLKLLAQKRESLRELSDQITKPLTDKTNLAQTASVDEVKVNVLVKVHQAVQNVAASPNASRDVLKEVINANLSAEINKTAKESDIKAVVSEFSAGQATVNKNTLGRNSAATLEHAAKAKNPLKTSSDSSSGESKSEAKSNNSANSAPASISTEKKPTASTSSIASLLSKTMNKAASTFFAEKTKIETEPPPAAATPPAAEVKKASVLSVNFYVAPASTPDKEPQPSPTTPRPSRGGMKH